MELNPNHKVTKSAHNQWHKIAAIMMVKLGLKELKIESEDIEKCSTDTNIVLDARGGHLVVRIVDDKTAVRLAQQAGGGWEGN